MSDTWNDDQPIYKQLRDRVAGLITDGLFAEGEAISLARNIAAKPTINHLSVGKAYQELVDQGVLEMMRGRGMFVLDRARGKLRKYFGENKKPLSNNIDSGFFKTTVYLL